MSLNSPGSWHSSNHFVFHSTSLGLPSNYRYILSTPMNYAMNFAYWDPEFEGLNSFMKPFLVLAIKLISCLFLFSIPVWAVFIWSSVRWVLWNVWWPWNFKNRGRFGWKLSTVIIPVKRTNENLCIYLLYFNSQYRYDTAKTYMSLL